MRIACIGLHRLLAPAFALALLTAWTGAAAAPAAVRAQAQKQAPLVLVFEEAWEPRTTESGVFGVVTSEPLQDSPDGTDTQQTWATNSITGRWGTLAGLDGSVPGFPDATGVGPNRSWNVRDGKLFFHARPSRSEDGHATDGFALVSKASFSRHKRIVVEADVALAAGTNGAFVGLALIAGEGDYREIAYRRRADKTDSINRVAPRRETRLASRVKTVNRFRIDYDPQRGFHYYLNGKRVGSEKLAHQGASFAADPNVGLYFAGHPAVGKAFAEGFVGPVRVWTSD